MIQGYQAYLLPHVFQNMPTSQLMAPAIAAQHLNADTPGRALDALYTYGVTELYRLIAATTAQRLGLTPTVVHLDGTSFHVDGRDTSDRGPNVQVIHITCGDSRDHRPDLNHVMLELMVEHHAGIPVLMEPLSGNDMCPLKPGSGETAMRARLTLELLHALLTLRRGIGSRGDEGPERRGRP
jgi:transposase